MSPGCSKLQDEITHSQTREILVSHKSNGITVKILCVITSLCYDCLRFHCWYLSSWSCFVYRSYLFSCLMQARDYYKVIELYLFIVNWVTYSIFSSSVCYTRNCQLDACDNYIMLYGNDLFPCGILPGYCGSHKKSNESYPKEFNTKYIYRWVWLMINKEPFTSSRLQSS